MQIKTLKAKKYYGRHAAGSVVLVDGHTSLHASDSECATFVKVLEGSLVPFGKPVCGICSCRATCQDQKPFLLGTMESAAVMVVTDKELGERVAAGEIAAFQLITAKQSTIVGLQTQTIAKLYYEQAAKLPRGDARAMYWLCQVPIMGIVVKENRWQRKSARRA